MSYLIVDEAEEDLEMSEDPFLEAGIDIPQDLPYQKHNNDPETVSLASTKSFNRLGTMASVTSSLRKKLLIPRGSKGSVAPESIKDPAEAEEGKPNRTVLVPSDPNRLTPKNSPQTNQRQKQNKEAKITDIEEEQHQQDK